MRVVIADDHRLIRETLADHLRSLLDEEGETEILEAASYDELLGLVQQPAKIGLILLDYHMPGGSSIANVTAVIAAFPETPVVVVSGTIDPALAMECVRNGAAGFIPKTVSGISLRNAIQVVLDGEKFVHSSALSAGNQTELEAPVAGNSAATPSPRGSRWSERESQTLDLLIAGNTNKQIARELGVQEMTVKTHVRNIYRKLGAVTPVGQSH